MENLINQITLSVPDVSVIIGVLVVLFFGKLLKDTWDTLSGR